MTTWPGVFEGESKATKPALDPPADGGAGLIKGRKNHPAARPAEGSKISGNNFMVARGTLPDKSAGLQA